MSQPRNPPETDAPRTETPGAAHPPVPGVDEPTDFPDPAKALSGLGDEDPAHAAARNARLAELRQQYPNQHVAYCDAWDGAQLVEPFFVAASADYRVVYAAVQALPAARAERTIIQFMLPLGSARMRLLWVPLGQFNTRKPVE